MFFPQVVRHSGCLCESSERHQRIVQMYDSFHNSLISLEYKYIHQKGRSQILISLELSVHKWIRSNLERIKNNGSCRI